MALSPKVAALLAWVRLVPPGRVVGYGQLGRAQDSPVSGLVAGKWLSCLPNSESDVPWWRVVGADGSFKTDRLGPEIGLRQRLLLTQDGIELQDDRVPLHCFLTDDELAARAVNLDLRP